VQQPNTLFAILSKMAQKPEVRFEKLFQKLANKELWIIAYQSIAPKPGNMTAGVDGKTIDGINLKLIDDLIWDLKASRYKPHPVRRVYIPKANGSLRPLGIPCFRDKLLMTVIKLILEAIYEPLFSNQSHRSGTGQNQNDGNEMVGRRRYQRFFRSNFALMGITAYSYGKGHSEKMAQGGVHRQKRPSCNRRGDSTGRNLLTCTRQHDLGWTREKVAGEIPQAPSKIQQRKSQLYPLCRQGNRI
jgi:hypothetical protein